MRWLWPHWLRLIIESCGVWVMKTAEEILEYIKSLKDPLVEKINATDVVNIVNSHQHISALAIVLAFGVLEDFINE